MTIGNSQIRTFGWVPLPSYISNPVVGVKDFAHRRCLRSSQFDVRVGSKDNVGKRTGEFSFGVRNYLRFIERRVHISVYLAVIGPREVSICPNVGIHLTYTLCVEIYPSNAFWRAPRQGLLVPQYPASSADVVCPHRMGDIFGFLEYV